MANAQISVLGKNLGKTGPSLRLVLAESSQNRADSGQNGASRRERGPDQGKTGPDQGKTGPDQGFFLRSVD